MYNSIKDHNPYDVRHHGYSNIRKLTVSGSKIDTSEIKFQTAALLWTDNLNLTLVYRPEQLDSFRLTVTHLDRLETLGHNQAIRINLESFSVVFTSLIKWKIRRVGL